MASPTITGFTLSSGTANVGGWVKRDAIVTASVSFSEAVFVTGLPQLSLMVGSTPVSARYVSGGSSSSVSSSVLTFTFRVGANALDTDGITLSPTALVLTGTAAIRNAANEAAVTTVGSVTDSALLKLDAAAALITLQGADAAQPGTTLKKGVTQSLSFSVNDTGTAYLLPASASVNGVASVAATRKKSLSVTDSTQIQSLNLSDLDAGSYRLHFVDKAGNSSVLSTKSIVIDKTPPVMTAAPVVLMASGASNGWLGTGDVVTLAATFNDAVNVTGSPTLAVQVGNATVQATYLRTINTTATGRLLFVMTVPAGMSDTDGISIGANAIALNGGSVTDLAGNTAILTHAAGAASITHKVDSVAPDAPVLSLPAAVQDNVSLSEVSSATGLTLYQVSAPGAVRVEVTITNASNVSKTYQHVGASGTFSQRFTLQDLQLMGPGPVQIRALAFDAAGNASVAAESSFNVVLASPTVSSVSLSGAKTTGLYGIDDVIAVSVKFSEAVNVTQSGALKPTIDVMVGSQLVSATYVSGAGTDTLRFNFTVAAGMEDANGVSVVSNSLNARNALITSKQSSAPVVLANAALPDTQAFKVATVAPDAPTIRLDADTGASSSDLITSNAKIVVEDLMPGGRWQYSINGGQTWSSLQNTGSAGVAHFTLPNGTSLAQGQLKVRQVDAAGNASTAAEFGGELRIDLSGGTLMSNTGRYFAGQSEIDLGANGKLIRPVFVEGKWYYFWDVNGDGVAQDDISKAAADQFFKWNATFTAQDTGGQRGEQFRFGQFGSVRAALPVLGSALETTANWYPTSSSFSNDPVGSSNPNFDGLLAVWDAYTPGNLYAPSASVHGWQPDPAISTLVEGHHFVNGTVSDRHGAIFFGFHNGARVSGYPYDGGFPAAIIEVLPNGQVPVRVTASGMQKLYANTGDVVTASAYFTENVHVTGSPTLALRIGSSTLQATYSGGSGTSVLQFVYTVADGLTDDDGISVAANSLSLNGGTIVDAAGNTMNLSHVAVGSDAGVKVDSAAPQFDLPSTVNWIEGPAQDLVVVQVQNLVETTRGPDAGLTWTLSGSDADDFWIDSAQAIRFRYRPDFERARDADGNQTYQLTVTASDAAGNSTSKSLTVNLTNNTADDTYVSPAGQNIIDLGAFGKLINPLYAEGKWFYFWDRSNDGVQNRQDHQSHLPLDQIFRFASDFSTVNPNISITGTDGNYRYATLNGVRLALPIDGTFRNITSRINIAGDEIDNRPADTFMAGYDDLAMINNAYAGSVPHYVSFNTHSASPSGLPNRHVVSNPTKGGIFHAEVEDYTAAGGVVLLEVLSNGGNLTDSTAPTLTSIAVNSAVGRSGTTLSAGDVVYIRADFSEVVVVTGTPTVQINVNGVQYAATYRGIGGGSGTPYLYFMFTVPEGLTDINGISIPADPISLNGGVISDVAGNNAVITSTAKTDNASFTIDSVLPVFTSASLATVAEGISPATVVYDANASDNGAASDTNLTYALSGDDASWFTIGSAGEIRFKNSPDFERPDDRNADNTYNLTVTATDSVGNQKTHAVSIAVSNVTGDNISNPVGRAEIGLGEYGRLLAPMHVDGKWYYYWDFSGNGAMQNLRDGYDMLSSSYLSSVFNLASDFTTRNPSAVLNESYRFAILNGLKLALPTLGRASDSSGSGRSSADGFATATAVSNGAALNTTYNDYLAIWDAFNGSATATGALAEIPFPSPELYKSGWRFMTATPGTDSGSRAMLDLYTGETASVGPQQAGMVLLEVVPQGTGTDTTAPSISSMSVASSEGFTNSYYGLGDTATFRVTFNEVVMVSGMPSLTVDIGGTPVTATYVGGSGSSALHFAYTVQAGHNDDNGFSIADNALSLNGGSIRDVAGNDALVGSTTLAASTARRVDTIAPDFNNVSTVKFVPGTDLRLPVFDAHATNDSNIWWSESNVTYALSGADANLFTLDQAGVLRFKANPSLSTPLDANQDHVYSVAITATDAGGNSTTRAVDVQVTSTPGKGQWCIDLGEWGWLIAPVEVEGKWYYHWARSGNGSLNSGRDVMSHDELDTIFKYASDFTTVNPDVNTNTTEQYRFATLNGIQVALPTYGKATPTISNAGTAVNNSSQTNATYDDLLAIWDAFNYSSTGTGLQGTPTDWALSAGYWSATPNPTGQAVGHMSVTTAGGAGFSADTSVLYVALQVL